jgi:hypothetical protein
LLQTSSKRWDSRPIASGRSAFFALVLLALTLAGRAGSLTQGWLFCPFRRLTDLPCPLCGISRAWEALVAGDWVAAVALHPFVILVAPVLIATAAGWRPGPRLFLAVAAAIAAFGLVRIAILTL